ncbi:segregation/condensation protein A [Candidatus Woesearchaeota archaeon]|nr:segregation/condensation protein A [Candidatus Woesearchaeota archaeon]
MGIFDLKKEEIIKESETEEIKIEDKNKKISVKQEQIQDLLFSRELSWQEIIYDLINTEQLDPWDIDLIVLTDKYLEKIREMEEADFFISSKVLLAASLLLRIKSEILLNKYVRSIDEILFGKKEEKKSEFERIELDEEIPELIPKTPLPRFKRVSLQELIDSLNMAITTENRRIKKQITVKNAIRESSFSLPKKKISIKDKINEVYNKLLNIFKTKTEKKISFNEFNISKDEKVFSFLPLLYLEDQKKIWLEQPVPFEEISIWLKEEFLKIHPDPFFDLKNPEDFEKIEEFN